MIIYRLETTSENLDNVKNYFGMATFENDNYSKSFFRETFESNSFEGFEKPPKVYFVKKDGPLIYTEVPDYDSKKHPIFSEKAFNCLKDLFPTNSEFMEIRNSDRKYKGKYFLLLLKDRIDCLDKDKSDARWNTSSGQAIDMYKYEFIKEKINKDLNIFRIPQRRIDIFVTEKFIQRAIENDLKNFMFKPVWSSDGNDLPPIIELK